MRRKERSTTNKIENYSVKIEETDKHIWYVETKGRVYRVTKGLISQNGAIKEKDKVYLTPYFNSDKISLRVKYNRKDRTLKCIVARAFLSRTFKEGDVIKHKDGNIYNCDANNLIIIIPKTLYAKKTGPMSRSKPCFIKRPGEDKPTRYRSIKAAARSLFVSDQTLINFIEGKHKGILHEMGIVAYYE